MPTFGPQHLWFLLHAAGWTLALSAIAFLGGGLLGFGVALARISRNRVLRGLASAYVQVVQGTPLLILLFMIYFGLAIAGFDQLPALIGTIPHTPLPEALHQSLRALRSPALPAAQLHATGATS